MKRTVLGVSLVCLLIFGAMSIEAKGMGQSSEDAQLSASLEAAEQAYLRIMEIYANQGATCEECHASLCDARASLDSAALATGQGNTWQAKQMLQEAMRSLRSAAQSLDDVPVQASIAVADQYRRILSAYGRLQGTAAVLGVVAGDMPVLQQSLSSIGELIENARMHQESREYLQMEQALQEASLRIRSTWGAIQEAASQHRHELIVGQYRSNLQENYQKANAIISAANDQGLDVSNAQGLLEQYRMGVERAMQGHGMNQVESYKKAFSDLAPIGQELREELQELVRLMQT